MSDDAFILVTSSITFTSTITISSGVTVSVRGTASVVLSGGDSTQLFEVSDYGTLVLRGLTLSGGSAYEVRSEPASAPR